MSGKVGDRVRVLSHGMWDEGTVQESRQLGRGVNEHYVILDGSREGMWVNPEKRKVDFLGFGPELVGMEIRVFWSKEDRWYHGTLNEYDTNTREFRIRYDDGDRRWTNLIGRKYVQRVGCVACELCALWCVLCGAVRCSVVQVRGCAAVVVAVVVTVTVTVAVAVAAAAAAAVSMARSPCFDHS